MPSTGAKKVAIITSSVRAVRVGPNVSSFIRKTLEYSSSTPSPELTVVDVAAFNLPLYNETVIPANVPARASFQFEHSKQWSAAIAAFDAYIFVSPEYNSGIPAGAKNAIDYLYNEWIGKPILIVTYGIQGGSSASSSLKTTFTGMKLKVVETRPQFSFADMGDAFAAMGTGDIPEATAKLWAETGKDELLKGFSELVDTLNAGEDVTVKDPVKEQVHAA
ncbi:NADPH-dependent FMN reductase [Phlyctema vagabunda]|uniref:NADPH-dependent FMN reductase n=1 Tax=Phlyctema vagabunda TaxID=108571 RepID=A0ABR4PUN2_9HELO